MIDVIRAGLLTTVQDLGRHGYRHLGVAMSGALDRLSLEVGNRLVGNRPDAACLEITFGPTVLRFPRATRIALIVDSVPEETNRTFSIEGTASQIACIIVARGTTSDSDHVKVSQGLRGYPAAPPHVRCARQALI